MTDQEYQPYDKSSKWLIEHHGDSMLRLAKIEGIEAWRPAQAEIVQPRQLPDGLLDVRLHGETREIPFVLEIATYPERRVGSQLTRDIMLVYLDRGEVPEAVVIVLRPKGRFRVPRRQRLGSRRGLSSCNLSWRVVELWTFSADELFESGDVGLIPWVPLAASDDPPERVARRCRDAIEQHAPAGEKANLLAVTQVLTRLRYNDPEVVQVLLDILGGSQAMIESPLIEELVVERVRAATQRDILAILETRFGPIAPELAEQIRSVTEEDRLADLVRKAASCPDLVSFREGLRR